MTTPALILVAILGFIFIFSQEGAQGAGIIGALVLLGIGGFLIFNRFTK